jgi:hypothetical protein
MLHADWFERASRRLDVVMPDAGIHVQHVA